MKEIRIHGRGGQGSVTMAQMMAQAAFEDGKWSQGFPSFGVERRGAPVQAFARIDKKKITDRSQVANPDYVIVQDSTLIDVVDVLKGLEKDGMVLVNTSKNLDELKFDTDRSVLTIDATSIALKHLGKPIMNTSLMGAFAGATGLIDEESIEKVVMQRFPSEVGEKNVAAVKEAFEEMR